MVTATLPHPRAMHPVEVAAAAESWVLVQRVQAGDMDAYGDLWRRYYDTVFRFLSRRLSNDRPLAEDLASETFTRGLRRINHFTWEGRDFGSWLITIARNLIIDHYKAARTQRELLSASFGDDFSERYNPPDTAPGPERVVCDAESAGLITAAVRTLNQRQRQCLRLRFWDGLSVTETAEEMGLQEGAVKALQYRAVRALWRNCRAELLSLR